MTPESRMPSYMIFPRFLFDLDLNETECLLYMILLDRARLSQSNGRWIDEEGHVFMLFPIKELAEALHRSETTIKASLASLEAHRLLIRRRKGIGRPSRIYLLLPEDTNASSQGSEVHLSQEQNPIPAMDRKPALSQTENCPSQGQKTVSLMGGKLPGSKNKGIKEQEINTERKESGSELHTAYGLYENVFLTGTELRRLQSSIPKWDHYINRLSGYMHRTGKKYANHAKTILYWAEKDNALAPVRNYTRNEKESL